MDVTLLFWTGALLDLTLVALLSGRGVALRRAGDIPGHRRAMHAAGLLVALFLGAYVLKLLWLGREDRSGWSAADRALLWLHESCVLAMLVGSALARWRARQFGAGAAPAHGVTAAAARFHRRAGWAAVVGAALGLATDKGMDARDEEWASNGSYQKGAYATYKAGDTPVVAIWAPRYSDRQAANSDYSAMEAWAKESGGSYQTAYIPQAGIIHLRFSDLYSKMFWNDRWIVVIDAAAGTEYNPQILVDKVRDAMAAYWRQLPNNNQFLIEAKIEAEEL